MASVEDLRADSLMWKLVDVKMGIVNVEIWKLVNVEMQQLGNDA